jgi:hypothetical protein
MLNNVCERCANTLLADKWQTDRLSLTVQFSFILFTCMHTHVRARTHTHTHTHTDSHTHAHIHTHTHTNTHTHMITNKILPL